MKYRKETVFVSALAFICFSVAATAGDFKKYEVRSGKVSYVIKGDLKMAGATQKLVGKKMLMFDRFGYRELEEEATVQKMVIMGQTQVDKTHKIVFRNGTKAKVADFNTKTIMEMDVPGMALLVAAGNRNLTQMGEEFLRKMGGKKTGQKTILGYTCDVWKMPVVTQCLYKGVPLEIISNVMGIKRTETAVKANFDITVNIDDYRMPNFKHQKISLPSGMDMSQTGSENSAESVQMLKKAFEGAAQSTKKGASKQAQSEQEIKNAVFLQMKQQIDTQKEGMLFMKNCLEKSSTLKEANKCGKIFSSKMNMPYEPLRKWDSGKKQEILKQIDHQLDVLACSKRSKTFNEMQQCTDKKE